MAMLEIKRSETQSNALVKQQYRNKARKILRELIDVYKNNKYATHTLIKLNVDELRDMLKDSNHTTIQRKINEIDILINKATQRFGNDEYLADSVSKFHRLLDDHPNAVYTLEQAFNEKPSSYYLALRLSNLYESNDEIDKAIDILQRCLSLVPTNKNLHFNLAMLYMSYSKQDNHTIIYHLRRSFTDRDSRLEAQFWYARMLFIINDLTYKVYFRHLSELSENTYYHRQPRGVIFDNDIPVTYYGTIDRIEFSFGFLKRDDYNDSIFFHKSFNNEDWHNLSRHDRVKFYVGFTYRGPCAINIKKV